MYLPPPSQENAVAEVTEKVVEITTTAPIVKPAESYLIEEVATSDVVDLKADEEKTEAAAIEPADTYIVETEAPVIETEAPVEETTVGAIKPAESYIVETEAPVVETEAPLVEATVAAIKPAESYIVETETPVVETEAPLVETTVAAIKPAESYIVETEAPMVETSSLVSEDISNEDAGANSETPATEAADVYLVPEESSRDIKGVDEIEVGNAGSEISSQANANIENPAKDEDINPDESIKNSVEPTVEKQGQAEGYWIEVSGDRDVLVKYHS